MMEDVDTSSSSTTTTSDDESDGNDDEYEKDDVISLQSRRESNSSSERRGSGVQKVGLSGPNNPAHECFGSVVVSLTELDHKM